MAKTPRKRRFWLFLGIFYLVLAPLVGLGVVELALRINFQRANHESFAHRDELHQASLKLFTYHPYLVVAGLPHGRASYEGCTLSHNAQGYRNPRDLGPKPPGVQRIVVLGGSTTYSTSVNDDQTWPALLEKELGPKVEVFNLGMPGYSTAEGIVQLALQLSDYDADLVLCYEGWNDLRNSHVATLASDYSDFHGRSCYSNTNINPLQEHGPLISWFDLKRALMTPELPGFAQIRIAAGPAAFQRKLDPRALDLFARNLRTMITLSRQFGATPVMVPQRLNHEMLNKFPEAMDGWVPLLKAGQVSVSMKTWNKANQNVCQDLKVDYVAELEDEPLEVKDFRDWGHMKASGNQKLAACVARYLRQHDLLKVRRGPMRSIP